MKFWKDNDDGSITILESGNYEISGKIIIYDYWSPEALKDKQITDRWTDLMFSEDLEE